MEVWHTVILAIVQGFTEFLPISSSAHLILAPRIGGWTDQGLVIDVALHAGTLAAVMLYFRRETAGMVRGGLGLVRGDFVSADARLALYVIVGTLPVVAAGFAFKDIIATGGRNVLLISLTTIGFGILLWIADREASEADRIRFEGIDLRSAFLIGLAQMLALVPVVSRSGITMTAALFQGFEREAAARFSLLLSIPTTAAAVALSGYDILRSGNVALQFDAVLAAGLAFFAGLAAIAGLMAWIRTSSFAPFVVYRLVLGTVLLVWFT